MALIKVTTNVFLVVLIFFACLIIYSEAGRTLKVNDNIDVREIKNTTAVFEKYGFKEAGLHGGHDTPRRANLGDDQHVTDAASTDDFRPTAPGHSPGAGHSRGPSTINPNQ